MKQQGDVLITKIDKLPDGAKRIGGATVAEGEATGHHHTFADTDAVELYEKDGVLFANVTREVPLVHQEHGAIVHEPGIYEYGIVQEWDYDAREARPVVD